MGIEERKQREKEARMELIKNSARRLFTQKGYENTSMDNIAQESELARTTLYLYFKTKADLFYSLIEPMFEEVYEKISELASDPSESPEKILKRMAEYLYATYRRDPEIFLLIGRYDAREYQERLSEDRFNHIRQWQRLQIRKVAEVIERGIARDIFRPVDPRVTAIIFWTAIIGIFQFENNRRFTGGRDHLGSTIEASVDLALSGIESQ